MKVLLWERGKYWVSIVLWDGKNTYWTEEMRPSSGHENLELNIIYEVINGRFTLIGDL